MKSLFLKPLRIPVALMTCVMHLSANFAMAAETPISGSAIYNNAPDPCCACIHMSVNGVDLGNDGRFPLKKTGDYIANVNVSLVPNPPTGSTCAASIPYTITANLMSSGIVISTQTKSGTATSTTTSLEFTLDSTEAKCGNEWQFVLACGNKPCEKFSLPIGDCQSCQSCDESGKPKVCNGPPTDNMPFNSTGGFGVAVPMPKANGGHSTGTCCYYAPEFSNPGRAALRNNSSSDFTLVKDGNGYVSSVNTGAGSVEVSPASSSLLAADPNAFTITHKDAAGTAFRTSTISFVADAGTQRLRLDTTYMGSTIRHEQTQPTPGTLVMESGHVESGTFEPLSQETLIKDQSTAGKRVFRRIVKERASVSAAWSVVSDVQTTWEKQTYDWAKTKEVIDPSGSAKTSTWSYYQPGDLTGPGGSTQGLGRVKQSVSHDGNETFCTYALNQTVVTCPYAGNPTGKTVTTTWDPAEHKMVESVSVNGNTISETVTTCSAGTTTHTDYTSPNNPLTTVTTCMPAGQDFAGKPSKVQHPDGTVTTCAYARNTGGGYTAVTETGASSNAASVSLGMRTTTIKNAHGTTILSKSEAIGYGTGSAILGSTAVTSVDSLGRALTIAHHPSSATVTGESASVTGAKWTTTTSYNCCGVDQETDMYGIKTFYAYDGLQRQIKSNRLGVTTETVRNGLTVETHRYPETVTGSLSSMLAGNSTTLVAKSVRNLTGTLQESWSPDPTSGTAGALIKSSSTLTIHKPAAGLSTRTITTTADNYSQTTDTFLDGRIYKTYGDLSPSMQYSYSVNSIGEVTTQSYVDGTTLRETTTTQSDWAGRTIKTTYMDGATATMTYNNVGQMVKSTDPDGVTSLFAYNAKGERTITAIDLNANGVIDYGVDSVQFSEAVSALDGSNNPVMLSTSKVWQPGDSNPSAGTVVSTSIRSADGLSGSSQSIGVANPSTSLTVLSGSGNWTTTQTNPDGTKSVSTYTNGRMVSSARLDANGATLESQSQGYDNLNRPITSTHSRTGTSTTAYLSNTADIVASVTDAGNRTTAFAYDIRGRRVTVDAPDTLDSTGATLANITNTTYFPDGQVSDVTGGQTYHVSHTYDYADRQVSMTTYGSSNATTTWIYSTTRGFLARKQYSDGNGTNYSYSAAGRLTARTWARTNGSAPLLTSYGYDNGGRLVITDYSDNTPDVAVSYDALGRQLTQSNGVARCSYSYNASTLQLTSETIAYDFNLDNTVDFTRVIDRSQDSLQRPSGFQLKNGTTIENQAAYAFGAIDGRLASVANATDTFSYGYLANSSLLATTSGPAHIAANSWDANRDVLLTKQNHLGVTTISQYDYSVNNLGQRTYVSQTGTAFAAVRSIAWGYDNLGQVVKADSSVNTDDRAFEYDGIGNRLKSADSLTLPGTNNYAPNTLNQYTAIDAINPVYDADGNATAYPLPANPAANSTMAWDAENRLVSTTVSGTTTTYQYDSQSRRISKTTNSATTVYVYDGWNPIAEYSASTLTKTYLWGLDLSGSMQGAGGVGGLLSVKIGANIYYPTFDGNGNVSEYLDNTGAVTAHFEYDPFGRAVVDTDNSAQFAYRFSTKMLDSETDLYYYGYRYYDPNTGRWLSKDSIGERGGMNLFGFVGNDGVNWWDYLGLERLPPRHHWFPQQNGRGAAVFQEICGSEFNIDDFTTLMGVMTHDIIEYRFRYGMIMQEFLDTKPDCCQLLQFVKDLMEITLAQFFIPEGKDGWMRWERSGTGGTVLEPELRPFNDRGEGSGSGPTNNSKLDEMISNKCGERKLMPCATSDKYRQLIKKWREEVKISNSNSTAIPDPAPNPLQEQDNNAIRRDEEYREWFRLIRDLVEKDVARREILERNLRIRYPNNTVMPPLRPLPPQPANRR